MSVTYKSDQFALHEAREHYARRLGIDETQVHWNCVLGGWELWHPGYSQPSPEPEPQEHFRQEHELYPWMTDGDLGD